jgi:hypothetical protein
VIGDVEVLAVVRGLVAAEECIDYFGAAALCGAK